MLPFFNIYYYYLLLFLYHLLILDYNMKLYTFFLFLKHAKLSGFSVSLDMICNFSSFSVHSPPINWQFAKALDTESVSERKPESR